jgi:hypothetical protein
MMSPPDGGPGAKPGKGMVRCSPIMDVAVSCGQRWQRRSPIPCPGGMAAFFD